MEPMRPLMGREWEEKMGVSSLSWVAITDVLNVLVIEFTAEAFVHEVMDGIRNREGYHHGRHVVGRQTDAQQS